MKNILITGGTGYIGSHTCLALLKRGFNLTIIDSTINSSPLSINRIKKILKENYLDKKILFFKGDIRDKKFLDEIFFNAIKRNNPIHGVIHFAGLKAVSESLYKPLLYWENNVYGSICLFEVMSKYDCKNIVFSSSASIYKNNSLKPIMENSEIKPCTPYGQTKAAIENILEGIFKTSRESWRIANLRYFNPIGAHESGLIGENSLSKPNNLFPIVCRVAYGSLSELEIFGNDWPTSDGTPIRDYIHIMDLAEAHCAGLDFLFKNKPQFINLNVGTGIGTSVLDLINKFMEVNKCKIPYKYSKKRLGDSPFVVADNSIITSILEWSPKRNIEQMCRDGWKWQRANPNGF